VTSAGRRAAAARRRAAAAFTAAAVLVVTGCAADPVAVYRDSAVKALEGSLSEARTAELAARLWADGRSPHAFAVVVVDDSETGVGADASWFEEQQPPRRADDAVRARTTDALDAAASAVQSVRIALDRSDTRATRAALDDLRTACEALETLAGDLS
jgi:hypothetical protein